MSTDFWVDALSVGIEEFDRAHREQLNLIGRTEEALGQDRRAEAILILHHLLRQMEDHQSREIDLLIRTSYPGVEHIRATQAANLDRLRQLTARIEDGCDLTDAGRLATQMRMTFVDYLLKGDINFKSHLDMAGYGSH